MNRRHQPLLFLLGIFVFIMIIFPIIGNKFIFIHIALLIRDKRDHPSQSWSLFLFLLPFFNLFLLMFLHFIDNFALESLYLDPHLPKPKQKRPPSVRKAPALNRFPPDRIK